MSNTPHKTPSRPSARAVPAPRLADPNATATAAATLGALKRIDAILQALPQLVGGELLRAVSQAPGGLCAYCALGRADWDDANTEAVDYARAQWAAAPDENRPSLLDFLPEALRPDPADPFSADGVRMPVVLAAATTLDGTQLCEFHIADIARTSRAGRTAGRQPAEPEQPAAEPPAELLVAPPGMDARTAARLAGQGIPSA